MTWFMERRPEQSHGGATGFTPPPGIDLTYVAPASSLAAMLGDGTLDAILFYPSAIDEIDRKPAGHRAAMNARTLFDDPAAECTRYVAATGILPMNHGVVLRRSVLAARPELAREVYDALRASRDLVSSARAFPYGLNANADALDALLTYLHEQHLTARRLTLDELFVPESRAWQP
jgi:4,5-dihydroxyphthalate decarboxylase